MERIPTPSGRSTALCSCWEAGHLEAALGDDVIRDVLRRAGSPMLKSLQMNRTDISEWLAAVPQQRDDFYGSRNEVAQDVVQAVARSALKALHCGVPRADIKPQTRIMSCTRANRRLHDIQVTGEEIAAH